MFVNVSLVSIGISKRQVIVIYSYKPERFVLVCGLWLTTPWICSGPRLNTESYISLMAKVHGEFMPQPGLKGLLRASSNWIVRPSVWCPSVHVSVIPSRLHTKCNILGLHRHIVTKLAPEVNSCVAILNVKNTINVKKITLRVDD